METFARMRGIGDARSRPTTEREAARRGGAGRAAEKDAAWCRLGVGEVAGGRVRPTAEEEGVARTRGLVGEAGRATAVTFAFGRTLSMAV